MRRKMKGVVFLIVFSVFVSVQGVEASIIINEIFSDPPTGLLGDANNDGIRSSSQDEFIEVLNNGSTSENISGWSLSDSVSVRHVFPNDTILLPYTFMAVFGGGSPEFSEVAWQTSSTGLLGLNNGGDMVSLWNTQNERMDQVTYGSIGGKDQSITLFPDGEEGEFVLHSELPESRGALFSPGTSVDTQLTLASLNLEEDIPGDFGEGNPLEQPVVPELPTLLYFTMGWGATFFRKRVVG